MQNEQTQNHTIHQEIRETNHSVKQRSSCKQKIFENQNHSSTLLDI